MKTIIFSIGLVLLMLSSCDSEEINPTCDIVATVRDYTGLDGCGFVFVDNEGNVYEPVRQLYCGTPPLPKEITDDPLYGFEYVDGKKISFSYEPYEGGSICMVGKMIVVTCLQDLGAEEKNPL
ncbi:MAG: hypothetical protein OEY51_05020 [Cyclobacteriaceae bacterium]|nr:hypothetical protein [Cyclobacteriaceae bacterium]